MKKASARRTLRIGIASVEEMKARSMAIARGEVKPASDEPKIWFPSAESLGKVLSNKNRALLARIRDARPQSLQALSELTGREVSNLSRTLKTMEGYGIVRLERGQRGRIAPRVTHDRLELDLPLTWSKGAERKRGLRS
jgi:predicted transcriptional regulator